MKKIFIILFLVFSTTAYAETLAPEDVESAFLFHFINYTQWDDHRPDYYVCIPDDAVLREAAVVSLKGKVVNNRRVVVVASAQSCHILVSDRVPPTESTLTVGPLDKGAMLEFRLVHNKIKFAANLK